jgi:hypothetical protein
MNLRHFIAATTLTLLLAGLASLPSCSSASCDGGGEGCPCTTGVECGRPPACTGWICDGTCHSFNERVGFRCMMDSCPGPDKCPGVCDGAGTCIGCLQDADCKPGHTCEAGNACSRCDDGVKNGDEADVDCGGSCPLCPGMCNVDADCPGGYCWEGLCARCDDGIQNGDETGVDCGVSGGHCPICFGAFCESGVACASGSCEKGLCCSKPCPLCYDCDLAGECFPVSISLYDTYGADPSITCSGNYVCDGKGRCALDGGQPCTQNNDCASEKCISGICKW